MTISQPPCWCLIVGIGTSSDDHEHTGAFHAVSLEDFEFGEILPQKDALCKTVISSSGPVLHVLHYEAEV